MVGETPLFQRFAPDLRGMATLAGAEGTARLLSFVFYVLAARALAPSGFGVVRYTIVLATIAMGLVQVLATALSRELGAARGDPALTSETLGSSVSLATVLWLLSLGGCAIAFLAGLTNGVDLLGMLVVLTGLVGFQLYYALSRGLGDNMRAGITYVGGSLAQILVFAGFMAIGHPRPLPALVIFGASSLLPVIGYELFHPLIRGRELRFASSRLRRLLVLGRPLLLAQVFFLVWNSADQVWVQRVLGSHDVGLYGAAKNVSQVFVVVPAGIIGVLLPRVAELRAAGDDEGGRRLAYFATALTAGISLAIALPVVVLRAPLLELLYGSNYRSASAALVGLSVAMVISGCFAAITTAAIGWGRPGLFTLGIGIAGVSEVVYLAAVGVGKPADAAWAFAVSISIALVGVLLRLYLDSYRNGQRQRVPEAVG
ncbi:MAG: oligosaccharide flippase family protein [Actinomycetota bacterium]|nr:oligosaccharide flippase family protein [Actinomycetota bacterium]